jgi:hypothetical protein
MTGLGNSDAPNGPAGGVQLLNSPIGHRTSRQFGWVLLIGVPTVVDPRTVVERDVRLRRLADNDWYRRRLAAPLAEVEPDDRSFVIDRYVAPDDGDRIIRWMEGRCHVCGR